MKQIFTMSSDFIFLHYTQIVDEPDQHMEFVGIMEQITG